MIGNKTINQLAEYLLNIHNYMNFRMITGFGR